MNLAVSASIRIIPEAVAAMALVEPTGMIDDRIEAYAVNVDPVAGRSRVFLHDVIKPSCTGVVLSARLCDEERQSVSFADLAQDRPKRAICPIVHVDHLAAGIEPLVVRIIIYADDVDQICRTAEVRFRVT
jgi:hypothetical protein